MANVMFYDHTKPVKQSRWASRLFWGTVLFVCVACIVIGIFRPDWIVYGI